MEVLVIEPTNLRGRRTIYNKNYYFATNMQYKYIWSVPRGLNAGYTEEAGYCIATSAAKDGLTYISIVLGAEADEKYIYSFTEAASMLKWALAEWGYAQDTHDVGHDMRDACEIVGKCRLRDAVPVAGY